MSPLRPLSRLIALRYAVEVARHGSFSGAARACGVTQPTVSAAVAELEQALGVTLFVRTTRAVALTSAGERLLPLIVASLAASQAVEDEATRLRGARSACVRVGYSPLTGAARVSALMRRLQETLASIEVVLSEASNDELEAALDAGTIDVAFGFGLRASRRRGRRVVYEDRLRFVRSWEATPPAQLERSVAASARLVLTADLCGLAARTRQLFVAAGLPMDVYEGRTMSDQTLETWALLGLGGAILPEHHLAASPAHPLLVCSGAPLCVCIEAVWRRDLIGEAAKSMIRRLLRLGGADAPRASSSS